MTERKFFIIIFRWVDVGVIGVVSWGVVVVIYGVMRIRVYHKLI